MRINKITLQTRNAEIEVSLTEEKDSDCYTVIAYPVGYAHQCGLNLSVCRSLESLRAEFKLRCNTQTYFVGDTLLEWQRKEDARPRAYVEMYIIGKKMV